LRQYQDQFNQLQVDIKIVTFDGLEMAQAYLKQTGLEWPLLVDSDRELYHAYGFGRASWWKLIRPSAIGRYLLNIGRGTLPGLPGKDLQQLGGDVLIDPTGKVRLIHSSQHPHDRPSPQDLLKIISAG